MFKHPMIMFTLYALLTLWAGFGVLSGAVFLGWLAANFSGFLSLPVGLTVIVAGASSLIYLWNERWLPFIQHLADQYERTDSSSRGY